MLQFDCVHGEWRFIQTIFGAEVVQLNRIFLHEMQARPQIDGFVNYYFLLHAHKKEKERERRKKNVQPNFLFANFQVRQGAWLSHGSTGVEHLFLLSHRKSHFWFRNSHIDSFFHCQEVRKSRIKRKTARSLRSPVGQPLMSQITTRYWKYLPNLKTKLDRYWKRGFGLKKVPI